MLLVPGATMEEPIALAKNQGLVLRSETMIRSDTYLLEPQTRRDYTKAKKRKEQLKSEGWRVKIRKGVDGYFEIWKKHVVVMDLQRGHGNGRVRA
jgi:hypothetical protein